jgi:hypothetical protein
MLRPTDAGHRQRIVMVHSAPITPDRKLVRTSVVFSIRVLTLSIIGLTPNATCSVSDLNTPRNDIRRPLITSD